MSTQQIVGTSPTHGKTLTRQVYAYVRVSATRGREGKDNFYSPEDQERIIREFCDRREWEIIDTIKAVGQSSKRGRNFETEQWLALKAAVSPGDAVVVAWFDRFGRDLANSVKQIEELEALGVEVVSATQTTGKDASGRYTRGQFLLMAKYELDKITESWDRVHARLHNDGVTHGAVPFGYQRPIDNGKPQPLEPHPTEAPVVEHIFRRRNEGATWAELVDEVYDLAGRRFTQPGLSQIVKNRVYRGEVKRGKRPVVKGAHNPLVSETLWLACQPRDKRRWSGSGYLLTGLVNCAVCGGHAYHGVTRYGGKDYRNYACRNRGCPRHPSLSAERLERFVLDAWWPHAESVRAGMKNQGGELMELEQAYIVAEENVRAWMQNDAAQRADQALWQEELDRRVAIKRTADRKLEAAHRKAGLVGLTALLRDDWEKMTAAQRRKLLASAIECVLVSPKDVTPRATIVWAH